MSYSLRNMPTTYAELERILKPGQSRTIANNTTAYRWSNHPSGNDVIDIHLHGHHIATLTPNSTMICDAGWQSNTTKDRINRFLSPRYYVCSQKFVWYVGDRYNDHKLTPWTGSFTETLETV